MRGILAVAFALGAVACTHYDADPGEPLPVPARDTFSPVSAMMEARCGTLDCHGSPARNMRVYGVYGLRADGNSVTGTPDTTEADVDATYESVVSIDPEVLSAVYAHGDDPSKWIVLANARGIRAHTGGTRITTGSAADECLVAWIMDDDTAVCSEDEFGPVPRDGETW